MADQRERPLYQLPAVIQPLDAARGTIIALDWRALRGFGVYADYETGLTLADRAGLLAVTAGSWVPLELVLAHYRALDALGLEQDVIHRVGEAVGEGVHGAFLSTLVRLAGKLGISPWLALEQCYKLWVRSWRGGAISVLRVGERLAQVSIIEAPVCASSFFCTSFAGALCAGIAPFGSSPEAHEVPGSRSHNAVLYRVAWGP